MDHGILNTPLRSRGNIDAQIDRYKAGQAAQAKAVAKSNAEQAKIDRAAAHKALDNISGPRLLQLAMRNNVSVPAMRKHLRSECHWQPKLIISLLPKA